MHFNIFESAAAGGVHGGPNFEGQIGCGLPKTEVHTASDILSSGTAWECRRIHTKGHATKQ